MGTDESVHVATPHTNLAFQFHQLLHGYAASMKSAHFTNMNLRVDGSECSVRIDNRVTLLDLLREHLGVTAPKKGCDHGQCGSCTVLLDGRRATTCLALAVAHDGADIVTAAGLARDGLHPVQQAFLHHDGYQCGYCTPRPGCSALGLIA